MFLQLSVILFTGGESTWAGTPPGQVHPPAGATPWAGTLPPGRYTPPAMKFGYGQQAGGTHPTGMHSCYKYYYVMLLGSTFMI